MKPTSVLLKGEQEVKGSFTLNLEIGEDFYMAVRYEIMAEFSI